MNIKIYLPLYALTAIQMLNNAGYSAYAVGGCVRDSIVGRPYHDIDIATQATPEQCKEVFKGYTIAETGIRYGTITVFIEDNPIEITTYRAESDYTNSRRPDSVEYIDDIKADCRRRDFTINALAYNPREGLLDFFGGLQDIKYMRIKCVGNPEERFKEDPLRILRAVRFAAQLSFHTPKFSDTGIAMQTNAHLLSKVSGERIYAEMTKILCAPYIETILHSYYKNILAGIIPEISYTFNFKQHNKYHIYDVWEHTAETVIYTPPIPVVRWAALLHDLGKPATFTLDENGFGHFYEHPEESYKIACETLKKFNISNADYTMITNLVRLHNRTIVPQKKAIERCLNKYDEQTLRYLIALQRADNLAHNPAYINIKLFDDIEKVLDEVISEGERFTLKQLNIKGNDLINMGIKPSPYMGMVLNVLLQKVIDGEVKNEKAALGAEVTKIIMSEELRRFD